MQFRCQIAIRSDWQLQHEADCGDRKVEPGSISGVGQVIVSSATGGLIKNEWEVLCFGVNAV